MTNLWKEFGPRHWHRSRLEQHLSFQSLQRHLPQRLQQQQYLQQHHLQKVEGEAEVDMQQQYLQQQDLGEVDLVAVEQGEGEGGDECLPETLDARVGKNTMVKMVVVVIVAVLVVMFVVEVQLVVVVIVVVTVEVILVVVVAVIVGVQW